MTNATDVKLDLILRQQKTLLERMRVIEATMATKVDIADRNGRIGGLYNAYVAMASGVTTTLERIRELDDQLSQVGAEPSANRIRPSAPAGLGGCQRTDVQKAFHHLTSSGEAGTRSPYPLRKPIGPI
jgi:hypothetical protein